LTENFQNTPVLGTLNSLQLSLPVVSNAASLTGSICNLSGVSAPAASSAWLLPSASGTSAQPLLGSAYLYQHSSATTLSGVTGQNQISTSAASYPGIFEWNITGSTKKKPSLLRDLTVTVINQDAAVSPMSMAVQYDKTSDANNMVPLYPSLSARLVQGAPSQTAGQGHSLSLPHQEGSTLGSLLAGELGPCLQPYGSVPHTRSRASAPQPEVVMVPKEVEPTNILPPASASGVYYSVFAQPITETSFQVMENSLGLQPPSQTFCLSQTPEFPKSCSSRNIRILESNPPPELGNISTIAQGQSSSNLLGLPPGPSQEQIENKSLDDVKTKQPKNLDPPLLPLKIPDIHHLLACIDPPGHEEQPGSEKSVLGNNSLSLEDLGTLENGTEFNGGFADIATLVDDMHLPQLFNSLEDLDQSKGPKVIKAPSDQPRQNKHKASEPIDGAPKPKIQVKNPECLLGGEVVICNAVISDKGLEHTAEPSHGKPQKAASKRIRKTRSHGQEKTKRTRENNSKKAEKSKQSESKVKAEEKPTVPRMKRKKNQPDLSQENFKKPLSSLGMHMLESVQVFHALGRKNNKKIGHASSQALGNSSNPKGPQPSTTIKPWLETPCEGKGPQKTQVKAQKPDGSAEKECPSPSQYELPPPGKVKLVPLPFPTLDKPQKRPVPRRPQSLASRRPAMACPPRPGSTNSAQPTAANPSRLPASTSLQGPAKPAPPVVTNPTRPSVPQAAVPRPAPYKTSSCTSLQREPIPPAVTKHQSPPKPQSQFLLQDFSLQPIPWRKPNVPEPAQQERENAAKYTSLGKVQFFIERKKEMEIARYYGYAV
uniref:Chromosome 2 open reading frame 78 n=1 Tax=Catagonus wagneri TaxID=51154 RepID=A0A8C3YKL6_9CETA